MGQDDRIFRITRKDLARRPQRKRASRRGAETAEEEWFTQRRQDANGRD
jgi:hypothetical protein